MNKVSQVVYSVVLMLILLVTLAPALWSFTQPSKEERYADLAVYDRHNGSQYSCNEINADLAYYNHTETHNAIKAARYQKEFNEFCND
jgi:hypothetical protein